MKKILCLALYLSLATFAHAMPGMDGKAPGKTAEGMSNATEKYTKMDSNGDKDVSVEEFKAAYPQMTDAVFGIINKDGKDGISLEEWMTFQTTHMQGMKEEQASHQKPWPKESGAKLIMPPKDAQ